MLVEYYTLFMCYTVNMSRLTTTQQSSEKYMIILQHEYNFGGIHYVVALNLA